MKGRVSRSLVTASKVRQMFRAWMAPHYEALAPDSLANEAFPISFLPSAGPNLVVRSIGDGALSPRWDPASTIQPCIRYWDIDNVGDGHHLSFFEMATIVTSKQWDRARVIADIYRFLTGPMELSKDAFWVTMFEGGPVKGVSLPADEQALELWQALGFPEERIVKVPGIEGFVANRQEPVGGYRTELYFERVSRCQGSCARCEPGFSSCGRFLEVATSVTYQYEVDLDADRPIKEICGTPIHAAGFGLERALQVSNGLPEIGAVDTMAPIRWALASRAPAAHPRAQRAVAKIADHLRALVFLGADDALELPGKGNKGRRWIRNMYLRSLHEAANTLGLAPVMLAEELLPMVVDTYANDYAKVRGVLPEVQRWVQKPLPSSNHA